jgi:HD-GYP domain-containing protein (c-di-GMP phosphodiesterase class II)
MSRKLTLAGLLSSLSTALDMVEGQPEGHAVRTADLAVRLGRALGLDQDFLADLYFGGVLKDSGCSNNSVRVQNIFGGDETVSKHAVKFIDWTSPLESVRYAFRYTERGNGIIKKLQRLAAQAGASGSIMNEVTLARCSRGAEIAAKLGFGLRVIEGVRYLDEHWDGKGAPYGLSQDQTPLSAQILSLAQTFEVFATTYGVPAAYEMARRRRGRWFNPALVQALESFRDDQSFWSSSGEESLSLTDLPELLDPAAEAEIDQVCEAFGMIVDAKSSYTAEHSSRVTQYSVIVADSLGFTPSRIHTIRRAGLLHDVGKLGMPTSILEKPGKLDPEEFDLVKRHPRHSDSILRKIPGFHRIADLASAHHERLDGGGYWRGLGQENLDLDMRILTACDVYDALTARRPYRGPMSHEEALGIMKKDEGRAFDPVCLEALETLPSSDQLIPAAA